MINGELPLSDGIFSSSTYLDENHLPKYGRLHSKNGAWSPKINDQMQYLQIDLPKPTTLFGVISQGNPYFDKYVTLFKVSNKQRTIAICQDFQNMVSFSNNTPFNDIFKK